MRRAVVAIIVPLLALSAVPQSASAQNEPRQIAVASTESWTHAGTGMVLPPGVGGLARTRVQDSTANEMDVTATYLDRTERIMALVYIYRVNAGDVAIWFDRTLATAQLPQAGGAAPEITGFTRPGASVASGLRTATLDSVPGIRSTAIAVAPLGSSWMIKVRMGSANLDPPALAERLTAFVAALRWPAEAGPARAAAPIQPCASPLQLREARIVRTETEDMLLDSVIGTIEPAGAQGPPPVFCREPGATVERGVYRANGATGSYLIALNDAGIAIGVGDASGLSALLGRGNRTRFSVTLYQRDATSAYPSFNRLPPPDQALSLVRGGQALSTTTDGQEGH